MLKIKAGELNVWQFENIRRIKGVSHFVTDRNSDGSASFTLSLSSSPDKDLVRMNRKKAAEALGIATAKLYFPSQVHDTRIVCVTTATTKEELLNTDALITNERGIGIAIMSADCVPILLVDIKNNAIGAVHSGWRGTVALILEKTLKEMAERFGTAGSDIIAGIGPSVSQPNYEVGEEVIAAVDKTFGAQNKLFTDRKNGKAKLDLWEANRIQLLDFGVPEHAIEVSNLCTVQNNANFFSARRGDHGRFAAGIALDESH